MQSSHWKTTGVVLPLLVLGLLFFVPENVSATTTEQTYLVSVDSRIQHPDSYLKKLLHKLSDNATFETLDRAGKQKLSSALSHTFRVVLRDGGNKQSRSLRALPGIRYVEQDSVVKAAFVPNDTNYSAQWHLQTLHMESAWDDDTTVPLYGGDASVIVAVLDTGAAFENFTDGTTQYAQAPDFAQTAFVKGYDFVNHDDHPDDDNGHGTHVTSTIAEGTNNSIAGAGIAFASSIMPVKILNNVGVGTISDVVQGIDYATEHNANIINLSLGSSTDSQTLRDAVQRALDKGVLVVAAVGNESASTISYPAAYNGVVAVSAVTKTNTLASYSNHGAGTSIAAPGGDGSDYIWQQTLSNLDNNHLPKDFTTFGMVGYQGTSQAAPQVSGIAALLLAYGVPASQIPTLLDNTATDLGTTGYDTSFGYGLVNAQAAFAAVINDTTAPTTSISVSPAAPNGLRGYYKTQPTVGLVAIDSSIGSGVKSISYFLDQSAAVTYSQPFVVPDGVHVLSYYAIDVAGNQEAVHTLPLQVDASPPVIALTSPLTAVTTRQTTIAGTITDSISGVKIMILNGKTIPINPDGTFQTALGLHEGKNLVVFRSSNNAGAVADTTIPITLARSSLTVIAPDQGGGPNIRSFTTTGKVSSQFFAFDKNFRGGVHIATADLNGDGNDEIIAAPASSGGPQVRIFDANGKLLGQFLAYDKNFHGGVNLVGADLNGDGNDEIIAAPASSGGPQVRIFDANGKLLGQFLAYDKNFHGGVNLARGMSERGGSETILTVPAKDAAAEVKTFDGNGKQKSRFVAFDPATKNGTFANSVDLAGKGTLSIATYAPEKSSGNVKTWTLAGKILSTATIANTKGEPARFLDSGFLSKGTHANLIGGRIEKNIGNVFSFDAKGKVLLRIGPVVSLPIHGFTATLRYVR